MVSNRWVAVDDVDPAINYEGTSWFADNTGKMDNSGNFGPPYLETLHGISVDGSVSFQFNGSAVELYGTTAVANAATNPDPSFQCFLDNVILDQETPFQFTENNWKLCGQDNIPDGSHTLRVDVKVQSSNHTFWLDQIRYVPSPSAPLDNKTILFANTDPAIQYDANWKDIGNFANMTTQTGSIAAVNFVGTSLSWYAYIPTELPHGAAQASWSLDNDTHTGQFLLKGLPTDSTISVYNQRYFTTPQVEAGPHNLVVTFQGSPHTTPLLCNYLYIQNGSFPVTLRNGTSLNGNPSSETSVPPDAQDTGSAHDKSPVGAILGGVLGGLAFLICIAAAALFWRRRVRGRRTTPPPQFSLLHDPEPQEPTNWSNHNSEPMIVQTNHLQLAPQPTPFLDTETSLSEQPQPQSSLPRKMQLVPRFIVSEQSVYHQHSDFSHSRTTSNTTGTSSWPQNATPVVQSDSVIPSFTTEELPPRYVEN